MVFGEIVLPGTRALIEDDLEEYPEFHSPELRWTGETAIPSHIQSLIFIENSRLVKQFLKFLKPDAKFVCSLQDSGFKIYEKNNKHLVVLEEPGSFAHGQIVEALIPWLQKASKIFTLTGLPLKQFQSKKPSDDAAEGATYVIKTPKSKGFNYQKLEPPNLITGLGASVLTYCICANLDCSSFVLYNDDLPLDSINCKAFIDLCKLLELEPKFYDLKAIPENNLYM